MSRRVRKLLALCSACVVAVLFIVSLWMRKSAPVDVTPQEVTSEQAAIGKESDAGSAVKADESGGEIDELLEDIIPEEDPAEVAAEMALTMELTKRGMVMHKLAPYSQVEASLKEEIREENSGISEEKIGDLLTQAAQSKEEFWEKGDFDNISSFDSIYRARATLELCLEADPTNAEALRQLVEVLMSGWPMVISAPNDKKLMEEAKANNFALHAPLWTLWEQHISKADEVSFEDFERALDLIIVAVPREVFDAYAADYRERNPSASDKVVGEAALAAGRGRRLEVADWALEVCQRKGLEWDVYARPLQAARDSMIATPRAAYFYTITSVAAPGGDHMEETMKYRLGRFNSFRGPKSRAARIVPYHERRRK